MSSKAKKVVVQVKLQAIAGKASPAPPVGTALGPHGINLVEFCKEFNAKTASNEGDVVPIVIDIYEDRSFSFVIKVSPVSSLILKALGIEKGSSEPHKVKVGQLSAKQVEEIAIKKQPDLNANDLEAAKNIVMGTARSMGVDIQA